jgi:SAM-dependent methyltransferase
LSAIARRGYWMEAKTSMTTITLSETNHRERFLKTSEARYLLATLPLDIAEKLERAFLNADLEGEDAKEALAFLAKNSTITRIVTENPSSAETFEYLYQMIPVDNEIDKFFIMTKAAVGIHQRLVALRNYLPGIIRREIIRTDFKSGDKFVIFNVGSGPGHDTIETLEENRDLKERVHVYCIDPDAKMLAVGEAKARRLGLEESFTSVPHKFGEIDVGKAHMILMIGLLCPMPEEKCVKILRNVSQFLHHSGVTVFNTVQNKMLREDPLCDFIMRLYGWRMDYKRNSQTLEIAKMAGLNPIGSFFDSLGYNRVVIARKTLR